MRQFSHYDDSAREHVNTGTFVSAISRDVPDIVKHGFKDVMMIGKPLGQIIVIAAFNQVTSVLFGKQAAPILYVAIITFPCFLAMFLGVRRHTIALHIKQRTEEFSSLLGMTGEIVGNIETLSDYDQRGRYQHKFEVQIKNFNTRNKQVNLVLLNNGYLLRWLIALLSACYVMKGGFDVIQGHASLGMFLANLAILEKLGKAWGKIYDIMLNILLSSR